MKVIPFVKYRHFMVSVTVLAIVALFIGTFLRGGFNLGIDFKPGISLTVKFDQSLTDQEISVEHIRANLEKATHRFSVQPLGELSEKTFVLRASVPADTENLQTEMQKSAMDPLETAFGAGKVSLVSSDYIGPSLSSELVFQTAGLSVAAMVLIFFYIFIRFKVGFALGAILSLIHDTLFVVGFIGITQMEVTSAVIAAVLTMMGYSLNDTIVVFDRIRENMKLMKDKSVEHIIDASVTRSLSRTLITSFLTFVATAAIWWFTNGSVKDFASAFIVGLVVGTYSSIYIASPVLLYFKSGHAAFNTAPSK